MFNIGGGVAGAGNFVRGGDFCEKPIPVHNAIRIAPMIDTIFLCFIMLPLIIIKVYFFLALTNNKDVNSTSF